MTASGNGPRRTLGGLDDRRRGNTTIDSEGLRIVAARLAAPAQNRGE